VGRIVQHTEDQASHSSRFSAEHQDHPQSQLLACDYAEALLYLESTSNPRGTPSQDDPSIVIVDPGTMVATPIPNMFLPPPPTPPPSGDLFPHIVVVNPLAPPLWPYQCYLVCSYLTNCIKDFLDSCSVSVLRQRWLTLSLMILGGLPK